MKTYVCRQEHDQMRHDTLINCFKVKCVIQLCLWFVNLFLLKYAHKNSNLLSAFLWLFQVTCKKTPEQCSHNDHVIWIFQSSLVFVIRIKIIKIRGSSIYFILTCDLPLLFSIFKLLSVGCNPYNEMCCVLFTRLSATFGVMQFSKGAMSCALLVWNYQQCCKFHQTHS